MSSPSMRVVKPQGDASQEVYRGRLEVSPTGSIPRRENPAWQVANDKVEASRAKLRFGQEAPKGIRPRTRVTRPQCEGKRRSKPDLSTQSSRDARAPTKVARYVSLALQACEPVSCWLGREVRRPPIQRRGMSELSGSAVDAARRAGSSTPHPAGVNRLRKTKVCGQYLLHAAAPMAAWRWFPFAADGSLASDVEFR